MAWGDGAWAPPRKAAAPAWLRACARRTLDLLLPPTALDGGPRPFAPGLSPAAWGRIAWIEDPVCDGCGAPRHFAEPGRCVACEARPRAFDRARAACLYDAASRDLILALKHGDRTDYAPLFARWLSRAAAPLIAEADWIAPVPMRPSHLFRRRYNQAAEIARPLARLAGRRYLPDVLVRVGEGGQRGRGRRGRAAMAQGAFRVTAAGAPRLSDARVLLVDDVVTTGATAEACARALKRAGAAQVMLAAVALTPLGETWAEGGASPI
ncbi:MAG: ComF family protein [Caulobacteraceae bacterium]|nr:ComF family protein [Caulobacter sp.]